MSSPQRKWSSPASRGSRLLVGMCAIARVLSLFVCLEFSGFERGLAEVFAFVQGTETHCDDCEDDTPDDCPPGCPTCHCASQVLAIPQRSLAFQALEFPSSDDVVRVTDTSSAPAAPLLAGVFRPPRIRQLDA